MTIVEKMEKIEIRPITLKLPVEVAERLDRYAALVGRDRSTVAAGLLAFAFTQDAEFAQTEGIAPVRRRRARATTNGEGD